MSHYLTDNYTGSALSVLGVQLHDTNERKWETKDLEVDTTRSLSDPTMPDPLTFLLEYSQNYKQWQVSTLKWSMTVTIFVFQKNYLWLLHRNLHQPITDFLLSEIRKISMRSPESILHWASSEHPSKLHFFGIFEWINTGKTWRKLISVYSMKLKAEWNVHLLISWRFYKCLFMIKSPKKRFLIWLILLKILGILIWKIYCW